MSEHKLLRCLNIEYSNVLAYIAMVDHDDISISDYGISMSDYMIISMSDHII